MDRPPDPSASADAPSSGPALPAPVVLEPRQRWRLTFAREPVPADAVGRAALDAWAATLAASGLPVAGLEPGGTGKARIAFAAPLPAAARGEAELAELWLTVRRQLWEVREALSGRMPEGHRWIGAEDVWIGAPPLAGRVAAADWRVEVEPPSVPAGRLSEAARTLVAARSLPRVRVKGGAEKRYDLRPLLANVAVDLPDAGGGAPFVRLRTRFLADQGAGRPEEVVAALAEAAGTTLDIVAITRERLLLAEDLPADRAPSGPC